jgi:hypothetical protein
MLYPLGLRARTHARTHARTCARARLRTRAEIGSSTGCYGCAVPNSHQTAVPTNNSWGKRVHAATTVTWDGYLCFFRGNVLDLKSIIIN